MEHSGKTGKLVRRRLAAHAQLHNSPADVVRYYGAVQAQDYAAAVWALGLRTRDASLATVEQAIADRTIVRTWPMRGTIHFVPAEDARWMLRLLGQRVIAAARSRSEFHGFTDAVIARCRKALEKALADGRPHAREEIYDIINRAKFDTSQNRGYHAIWRLSQEGFLCGGPRDGKLETFVLLDAWVPKHRDLAGDEALAEITRRYFTSHGPASIQDFVWWSGLKVAEAKHAVALLGNELVQEDGMYRSAHAQEADEHADLTLLPGFDEYLVAYKNRDAVLDAAYTSHYNPGNGFLSAVVLIDGIVHGTWKRSANRKGVVVEITPFTTIKRGTLPRIRAAAERYGKFLGKSAKTLIKR